MLVRSLIYGRGFDFMRPFQKKDKSFRLVLFSVKSTLRAGEILLCSVKSGLYPGEIAAAVGGFYFIENRRFPVVYPFRLVINPKYFYQQGAHRNRHVQH